MSTWKIIAMAIAWAFAAGFIAVVSAIVLTELLNLVGFVESGEDSYSIALNVTFFVVFVALLAVPVVFRSRFITKQASPPS